MRIQALRVVEPAEDIQFDIDRGQLAIAVNLAMLRRMIFQAISEKISEKLVFPNCQGFSLAEGLDTLDVKRPSVEGVLVVTIRSIDGIPEPGLSLCALPLSPKCQEKSIHA